MINRIRKDIDLITQKDFAVDLIFNNLNDVEVTVKGLMSKHNLIYDPTTGLPIKGKNIHCAVTTRVLDLVEYPYKNAGGEIAISGHHVTFEGKEYVINETLPNETTGLIVIILGEYE
jgi:hypothetical protein